MIEAKMKEQAIFQLYNKYPQLNCKKKKKKIKLKIMAMQWAEKCLEDCECC